MREKCVNVTEISQKFQDDEITTVEAGTDEPGMGLGFPGRARRRVSDFFIDISLVVRNVQFVILAFRILQFQ